MLIFPSNRGANKFKKEKQNESGQGSPQKASLNESFPACVTAGGWRARPGGLEWRAPAPERRRVLCLCD